MSARDRQRQQAHKQRKAVARHAHAEAEANGYSAQRRREKEVILRRVERQRRLDAMWERPIPESIIEMLFGPGWDPFARPSRTRR